VLATVHTGMETALVVLLLALFFNVVPPRSGAPFAPAAAAALTVLIYLARPDAAAIPIVATAATHGRAQRRDVTKAAALLAIALGGLLVGFRLYYGSALPLPFYWKTLGLTRYDAAFVRVGHIWKLRWLLTFLAFTWPAVWIASRARSAAVSGLLLSALAFVAYHLLFTNQVMGYHARFLLPATVPVALAAAIAWPEFQRRARSNADAAAFAAGVVATGALVAFGLVERDQGSRSMQLPLLAYVGSLALAACFLFGRIGRPLTLPAPVVAVVVAAQVLCAFPPRLPGPVSDLDYLQRYAADGTTLRGLWDVKACIPEPLHLYHSEIGVPGLVLANSKVTDLGGLMSRQATLAPRPFDEMCLGDRPEALFLPHRNYAALNREIASGRCLRGYTRVVDRSSSPLFIRSDLVSDFLACARTIWPWTSLRRGRR
jgi:hypothetical protein